MGTAAALNLSEREGEVKEHPLLVFSWREMQPQAVARMLEVVQERMEGTVDSLGEIKTLPGTGMASGVVRQW